MECLQVLFRVRTPRIRCSVECVVEEYQLVWVFCQSRGFLPHRTLFWTWFTYGTARPLANDESWDFPRKECRKVVFLLDAKVPTYASFRTTAEGMCGCQIKFYSKYLEKDWLVDWQAINVGRTFYTPASEWGISTEQDTAPL